MGDRSRRSLIALATCLGAVLVVNLGVVFRARSVTHDVSSAPALDTVIVLGAFVRDGGPSPVLEDRLDCARAIYASGRAKRVLVTGDHGREGYDETDAMAEWLVTNGVPNTAIVRDHAGFRTLDSMDRARNVFGIERAVICTQAFHLPRSLFLAKSFGIAAEGAIADRRTYRGAVWNQLREGVARPIAVGERLFGRRARHVR